MSTIEGRILVRNNTHEFHIEKKNPSYVKGILYGTAGFAGAATAWHLTKLAASNLVGAVASKLFLKEEFFKYAKEAIERIPTNLCEKIPVSPGLFNVSEKICGPIDSYLDPLLYETKSFLTTKLRNYTSTNIASVPYVLAAVGLTALAVNVFVVNFTGHCFTKAIRNFGPKYEVIKGGEVSKDKWTAVQRRKVQ